MRILRRIHLAGAIGALILFDWGMGYLLGRCEVPHWWRLLISQSIIQVGAVSLYIVLDRRFVNRRERQRGVIAYSAALVGTATLWRLIISTNIITLSQFAMFELVATGFTGLSVGILAETLLRVWPRVSRKTRRSRRTKT